MTIQVTDFPATAKQFKKLILSKYGSPPPFTHPPSASSAVFEVEGAKAWNRLDNHCTVGSAADFCDVLAIFVVRHLRHLLTDVPPQMFNAANAVLQKAHLFPARTGFDHQAAFYRSLASSTAEKDLSDLFFEHWS